MNKITTIIGANPPNFERYIARDGRWKSLYDIIVNSKVNEWIKFGGFENNTDANRFKNSVKKTSRNNSKATFYERQMCSDGFRVEAHSVKEKDGSFSVWVKKILREDKS